MTSRERLLETASTLFRRQGFHATGLNQILAESGAPKGVLYHHFPGGKQQLAAESVARSGVGVGLGMSDALDRGTDVETALSNLAEYLAVNLERSGFTDGCPVASVALDAAGGSETIRTSCHDTFRLWLDGIESRLETWGVQADERPRLAAFTLSSIEGALLLARVQHDVTVIHDTCRQLATIITQTAETA